MWSYVRLVFSALVMSGVGLLSACTPKIIYVSTNSNIPLQNQTIKKNVLTEELIAKYVFGGASAESVRSGLGEPNIATTAESKAIWVYDEIYETVLSTKSSTLVVRFNSNNKVQSVDTHVTNIKK